MPTKRELERELDRTISGFNSFVGKVIEVFGLTGSYPPPGISTFISDVETVYDNDRQITELSEATKRLKGK